jgi:hypothetical protein
MNTRPLILALAACTLAAPHAASQAAARPAFCTRAAPPPTCGTFLVVEAEMGGRSRGARGELDLSWQAGVLANHGRSAVGATAFVGFGLDVRADRPILDTRFGVLPRYRRWLSSGASLDLSAGPVVELRRGAPAALLTTTGVAVGWANDIALSARVDVSGGNRPAWFVGVRLGIDQVTEALEAQGIGVVLWGIIRFLEKASGS